MIRHKTATAIAFLLAAASAPGIGRADPPDAEVNYLLTDPVTSNRVQVMATAVISENMVIQFVTPMNLGISGEPGATETLRLINTTATTGQARGQRGSPPLSASVAVQGLPNQTFAVSIEQGGRGANGPDSPMIATFTHDAGKTPYIGPAGNTEFRIGAALRLARSAARLGYSSTLDLIVSHN